MTLLNAQQLLYEWFCKNDTFRLDLDLNKLVVLSESPNETKAIIKLALKTLVKLKMLKEAKLDTETKESLWVLVQPLENINQTILINGNTAKEISKIINDFSETIDNKNIICDVKNISEKDIHTLMAICMQLIDHLKKQNESEE